MSKMNQHGTMKSRNRERTKQTKKENGCPHKNEDWNGNTYTVDSELPAELVGPCVALGIISLCSEIFLRIVRRDYQVTCGSIYHTRKKQQGTYGVIVA